MPTYRVYLLKNPDGKTYNGLSEDIPHRLEQHNAGASRWTARLHPWHLVWQSRELTLSGARRLEDLLKRQKGGNGIRRIMDNRSAPGSLPGS